MKVCQRRDKRLKNKAWRKRVGFDNIDSSPIFKPEFSRVKYESPAERQISDEIDSEVFLRS